MTIAIHRLTKHELSRVHEIDVSETGAVIYRYRDGALQTVPEQWTRPHWTAEAWQAHLQQWITDLHPDLFLGAFDGEQLVGLASLRYQLTSTTAQLTTLHISRSYRRQGVASALVQEVIRLTKEDGAQTLYVSAVESASAVNFYLRQGFRPTDEPDPVLFALEPNDIHMVMTLCDT
jgi:ribosomal protein S18 acetylase RimI-like enzyme